MELINKFDNALAGVAGDSGNTGVVVNGGNRLATGHFWRMQHCNGPPDEHDKQQPGVYDHDENDVLSNVIEQFLPLGAAPVYPKNSNCNVTGLTDLGEHAVRGLMQRKMILDPDHLSVRARKSVMDLLEAARYSGAVSSHSWSTADVVPRIYKLGGVVTPMKEAAPDWIKTWQVTKAQRDPRFYFGFGYGSDQNGLSSQPHPRDGRGQYPFKSFDGRVTFQRQRSGVRDFDFTKDGVAHYGLFPDWWEDIRVAGGAAAVKDMARGAEAYLQEWERVNGIRFGCKPRNQRFTRRGRGGVRLRATTTALLRAGRAAQGSRPLGLELVRARKEEQPQARGGGAHAGGPGGAGRQQRQHPRARARRSAQHGQRPVRARRGAEGPLRLRRAARQAPGRRSGHPRGVEEPHRAARLPEARQVPLRQGCPRRRGGVRLACTQLERRGMDLYVILRRNGWKSGDELETAAGRSTAEGDKDDSGVRWIRSYVLAEESGGLGTVCIYEADSPEAIRAHASAAGLPADEIIKVADTVIVRPDPTPVEA